MAVLAISRQRGSEGSIIARALAERLSYRYVDKDALVQEARKYGLAETRKLPPEIEEKAPSFWERLNEERQRYQILLRAIILDFAEQDNVILAGRGSEVILKDVSHVLRAKVVAPVALRIRRIVERGEFDAATAPGVVHQSDRDRAGYFKYLFHADWMDYSLYDVVINSARTRGEAAIGLLEGLLRAPEFAPTPKSLALLRDMALASRVEVSLTISHDLGISDMQVAAHGGAVELRGTVFADELVDQAEEIARKVPGVGSLDNELVVQPLPMPPY